MVQTRRQTRELEAVLRASKLSATVDKRKRQALKAKEAASSSTPRTKKGRATRAITTATRKKIRTVSGKTSPKREGKKSGDTLSEEAGDAPPARPSRKIKAKTAASLGGVRKTKTIVKTSSVVTWEETKILETMHVATKLAANKLKIRRPLNWKRKKSPKKERANKGDIELGKSPFLYHTGPPKDEPYKVFQTLKEFHEKDSDRPKFRVSTPRQPGHAYEGDNFHAIVMPILSQSTENVLMKIAEKSLYNNLKYKHNGEETVGNLSPNYHAILNMEEKDFQRILAPGGLNNKKAIFIQNIARSIYDSNTARFGDGAENIQREAENAPDWVDGLLSLEFLRGLSAQEMFDKLMSFEGVGPKTAACILCFTYNFPVFAVDAHVYRQCRWFPHWLPPNCSVEDAFPHLDEHIPDEVKRDLHQLFWHHGQKCIRCRGDTDENTPGWNEQVCVLEQFGIVRWTKYQLKKHVKGRRPSSASSLKEKSTEPKPKRAPKTIRLETQEEIDEALEANYDVHFLEIEDAFSASPENSNFRKERMAVRYVRDGEEVKSKKTQKTRRTTKRTEEVTHTDGETGELLEESIVKDATTEVRVTEKVMVG